MKLDLGKAFRASDLVTTETLAGYAIILFISRKELLNNLLKGAHRLHNQLTDLPAADVIVQSGDFTLGGSEKEAIDFMQWFSDLPYKHKVLSQATMICACMEQTRLKDCRRMYITSATPVSLLAA